MTTDKYKNNETFGRIRELIEKEQAEAFGIFERGDFVSRLERRTAAQSRRKPFFVMIKTKPAYALAAAILVLAVTLGIMIVTGVIPPSSHSSDVRQIEHFFLQMPQFRDKSIPDKGAHPAQGKAADPRSQLEWFFKDAYYRVHSREYSRRELRTIFKNMLCFDCREKEKVAPPRPKAADAGPGELNLEKRIKRLMKGKMIDHFLNKLSKDKNQKEV